MNSQPVLGATFWLREKAGCPEEAGWHLPIWPTASRPPLQSRSLGLIKAHPEYREHLWEVVNALQGGLKAEGFNIGVTESPVTPVFFEGGVNEGTNVVVDLRENYGIFCSIVTYPVIPKGQLMLRIIPTASHTLDHVKRTIEVFKDVQKRLKAGFYEGPIQDMNVFKRAQIKR